MFQRANETNLRLISIGITFAILVMVFAILSVWNFNPPKLSSPNRVIKFIEISSARIRKLIEKKAEDDKDKAKAIANLMKEFQQPSLLQRKTEKSDKFTTEQKKDLKLTTQQNYTSFSDISNFTPQAPAKRSSLPSAPEKPSGGLGIDSKSGDVNIDLGDDFGGPAPTISKPKGGGGLDKGVKPVKSISLSIGDLEDGKRVKPLKISKSDDTFQLSPLLDWLRKNKKKIPGSISNYNFMNLEAGDLTSYISVDIADENGKTHNYIIYMVYKDKQPPQFNLCVVEDSLRMALLTETGIIFNPQGCRMGNVNYLNGEPCVDSVHEQSSAVEARYFLNVFTTWWKSVKEKG